MSTPATPSAPPTELEIQRRDADLILTELHSASDRGKSIVFLIPRFRTVYIKKDEPVILDMGLTTWAYKTDESKFEHWVVLENEGIGPSTKGNRYAPAPKEAPKYTHGPTKTFKRQDRIPGLINRRIEEAKKTKDLVYIVGHGLEKPLKVLKEAFEWKAPQGVSLLDTQLISCTEDPTLPTLRYALKKVGRVDLVGSLGNTGNDAYCISYLLRGVLRITASRRYKMLGLIWRQPKIEQLQPPTPTQWGPPQSREPETSAWE